MQVICILAETWYTGNCKSFAIISYLPWQNSMIFEALFAALLVAAISLVGVLFFGHSRQLVGIEKYSVPVAVGVFLSITLFELIPETLESSPELGGLVVALGFISFYILANVLHGKLHKHYCHLDADDCDRKGAALLILIGDAIHNIADGVVLGGAFLIDPAVGIATAVGLALHELPQEIVEFGILLRAGYSKRKAAFYNFLSATSIVWGLLLIFVVSNQIGEYVWILTGVAAGNLLFLAASDLLPRIHGNLKNYGSFWHSTASITLGFLIMTSILTWTHDRFGPEEAEHAEEVGEYMENI